MHDEPQILLVDAKPERVRRDHRFETARHESILRAATIGRRHLSMIQADGIAVA